MTVWTHVEVALSNLRSNKVRSFLSILGIVVGTGAVIVVTSLVNGTRKDTMEMLMAGTEDLIILRPTYSEKTGRFGKINISDLDRMERIPYVKSILPDLFTEKNVRGTQGKTQAKIVGVNESYIEVYGYELIDGKPFTKKDVNSRVRGALIDEKFARKIFGLEYPIGKKIRLEETTLEVVGLVKVPEKLARTAKAAEILTPVNTLLRIMDTLLIYQVEIRSEPGKIDEVKKSLNELISQNPRQKDLLEIEDPRDYLKEINNWARTWMIQMVMIAGISLVVGGIGLMNVMLTTVAERTHEIGLRKAVGASSKIIQNQFLVESATLSGVGGITGVLVGVILSYSIGVFFDQGIKVSLHINSLFISFGFSVLLGVVFGLYPASKAAHMSPVEALRYE